MIPRIKAMGLLVVSAILFATPASSQDATDTWRGLMVAPEHRCSPYERERDYPYPQSMEQEIVRRLGGVYGPYTDTCFASARETDIEHIVATSEAHDSGLCARDRTTRARFASDLRNLTLASPRVNRHRKSGKDAAEWLPQRNRCWFAARVVEVRRAYDLTIDRREAVALERILAGCESTDMEPMACTARAASARRQGRSRRRRSPGHVRRQRQRPHHVQGSQAARHRAGAQGPSRLPVHAGRRRGRGGLRVSPVDWGARGTAAAAHRNEEAARSMRLNRHGSPALIAVAVANVSAGTSAAAVKHWRRRRTSGRGTEVPACRREPAAPMRRSGSDTDPLTSHGPRSS